MEIDSISAKLDRTETIGKNGQTSNFRIYASQIYATFATNLVNIMFGSVLGFTSVLIAELHKENAEIDMNVSKLTWFSSFCFMRPVGCLVFGLFGQRFGSRATLLLCATFYIISFVTFYFATNSSMLICAQVLGSLITSISFGSALTYVTEITQPQLRSVLIASITIVVMSAAFFVVLLSNFLYWRVIALLLLVFPIMGFVAVCTIPESPHWLASRNKFDEAEAALSWLRGWRISENVILEFEKIRETYDKSYNSLAHSSIEKSSFRQERICSDKNIIKFFLDRSFYFPLLMICLLHILHNFTGFSLLLTYSIVVFRQIDAPINPHMAASIFDGMRVLGALACMLLVHYTGKKKLTCITLVGAALTLFTSSTALLLKENNIYPITCQWVAMIAIMLTTFLTAIGIDKIVFMLNGEIFPTRYRNLGSGIGLFTTSIATAIINKSFFVVVDTVTLPVVFIILGISCLICCVMLYFMFPETEGKTLQEIEEYYSGITRLEKNENI